MQKKVLAFLLAVAAYGVSCAKNNVEVEWNFDTSESRMVQADAHLYVRPFIVDLEILTKERLSWKVTISGDEYASRVSLNSKGEIMMEATQQNMQSYAIYRASVGDASPIGTNSITCDVIVAPLFNMKFNQNGCVIEFTGYPARYTNWKSATVDEFRQWIMYDRDQEQTKRGVAGTVGVEEREVRVKEDNGGLLNSLTGK